MSVFVDGTGPVSRRNRQTDPSTLPQLLKDLRVRAGTDSDPR